MANQYDYIDIADDECGKLIIIIYLILELILIMKLFVAILPFASLRHRR